MVNICDTTLPEIRKQTEFLLIHPKTICVLYSVFDIQRVNFGVAKVPRFDMNHMSFTALYL